MDTRVVNSQIKALKKIRERALKEVQKLRDKLETVSSEINGKLDYFNRYISQIDKSIEEVMGLSDNDSPKHTGEDTEGASETTTTSDEPTTGWDPSRRYDNYIEV